MMNNTSETKEYRKFGMLDNLSYAAGDFGCNMSFALKGTLIIFWTQFMQMDSITYAGYCSSYRFGMLSMIH